MAALGQEERPMELVRILNNFRNDRFAYLLSQIPKARRVHGRRQLEKHGVVESILEFTSKRPSWAFAPDYGDLWFLYGSVRKRRPALVLEFGSGVSTVTLACALKRNQLGYLYSVDGDEEWAKSTGDSMPTVLRSYHEVRYHEVIRVDFPGQLWGLRHVGLPDLIPNMVYLDGPEGVGERRPAIDLLDMEPRFPHDFFLVIDDRKENTTFLREHFKRRYRFRERRIQAQPTFELCARSASELEHREIRKATKLLFL